MNLLHTDRTGLYFIVRPNGDLMWTSMGECEGIRVGYANHTHVSFMLDFRLVSVAASAGVIEHFDQPTYSDGVKFSATSPRNEVFTPMPWAKMREHLVHFHQIKTEKERLRSAA